MVEGKGNETALGQRSRVGARGLLLHARQWSRDHGEGACLGGRGLVEVAHHPYALDFEVVASRLAHRAHNPSYTEPVSPTSPSAMAVAIQPSRAWARRSSLAPVESMTPQPLHLDHELTKDGGRGRPARDHDELRAHPFEQRSVDDVAAADLPQR